MRRGPIQLNVASGMMLCTLMSTNLLARDDAGDLCRMAAEKAANRTGVPFEVLLAISTVETGRQNQPWPWTVNFGGDGHWYDSAAEAETSVQEAIDSGVSNIDLGCFQLNYRWHADGFASLTDMLDPDQNAVYAAEFLASHFAEAGDWATAAAAYHSATPEYATVYKAKFEAVYTGLGDGTLASLPEAEPAARSNRFPLLTGGAKGTRGSLFPDNPAGRRLIGGS